MKRRAFIAALGGAAAWPLAARAQSSRLRRIGMLLNSDNPQERAWGAALTQALQDFGWTIGRNVQIDLRFPGADRETARQQAAELIALGPDVIVTVGGFGVGALLQNTRTVPIIFTSVTDPVGAGFVESLSRPGGNATGFLLIEYGFSGKWLELLKEVAPRITRAAILRDPGQGSGSGQFGALQAVAPGLGVELRVIDVREAGAIERAVESFAREPNGGLIVPASAPAEFHRNLIIAQAAHYKMPAVYSQRDFPAVGGLLSYGPNVLDQFRRAASYIDRILRGANPGDLPVQAPTKYELAINLKTAKALGLEVPHSLLARADEVIE